MMRHFTKMIFLWGTIVLIVFGCEEDELQSQINALEFELIVLDEEGNEKSIFEANTDIILGVRVSNKSGKDFLWEYSYGCQLTQIEDFLLVYKSNSEVEDHQIEPIGRPYLFPSYCLGIYFPPDTIPPGMSMVFGTQWSNNPANAPLGAGKYFTGFQHTLDLGEKSKNIDLKVEFEMK